MIDLLDPVGRCLAELLRGEHGIRWVVAFVFCAVALLLSAAAAIIAEIAGAVL